MEDISLFSEAQQRDQTPTLTRDVRIFTRYLTDALEKSNRQHMMTVFTAEAYGRMRLYLTPDNLSGFALDNRALVSVFSHPDAPRGRLASLVAAATAAGARTLDVFDLGGLPRACAAAGFHETSRVPFDAGRAPAAWREELGRPDVVFMAFTPARLRVLVGCSCSGITRRAFRALGHDAWSADLKPAEDSSPYHYKGDVREVMAYGWDIGIFHPTCRYLTNSGVRWLFNGDRRVDDRWEKMRDGAAFFKECLDAPIPRKAVENPVMHGHAKALIGRAQTQVIQPWMFGHTESKATCLWLENLPSLVETENVYDAMMKLPYKDRNKVHYASPGPEREANRSRALPGISAAMALQWGGPVQS